ncbi:hypothetical protein HZB07_01065 [Candidatus Saganbacteria bacterium]|nr:hypothetical protein [Candidatus Saganbacteria bacterium]
MKKIISLMFCLLIVFAFCADAAQKTVLPPKLKITKTKNIVIRPAPVPLAVKSKLAPVKRLVLEAGFAGGAGLLDLGYLFPLSGKPFDLKVNGGIGFGNGYNLWLLQGQLRHAFNSESFGGISLDWANYSETVRNLIGLSGNVAKGGNFGVGIFTGRIFDKYNVKIGYSSVLGVNVSVGLMF